MRGRLAGVVAAVTAIAALTGLIALIDSAVPVLGLAVLYMFAVLPISIVWGMRFGIGTAIASMVAFNYFFLEPVYTLRVSDSGNWVALVVFIFTAVVVSELAARSRRRATEAATLAARADVLKQSDALKTALLRAVSHDLRSPLMAILTSSSTLAQHDFELDADDRRELLATITSEAGRLDRLVANLLDLSKLQAGAAVPNPDLWPLDELVGQALHELGAEAARVEVELPDREVAVKVDPGQIERVLANLIENALKYSPGAVSVAVSTAGGSVMVRVTDHGAGISKDELERIFEPFHRGSSVGEARGAGLGLAIARGFAEANGGRVWAESRRGEGATFVLTLPAEQPVEVRV